MNAKLAKLCRRNARAVAGIHFRDNPTTYTFKAGTVRQKLVHTGNLLSSGLPEVIPYTTFTQVIRQNSARAFLKEEKRWARRLGTVIYSTPVTN